MKKSIVSLLFLLLFLLLFFKLIKVLIPFVVLIFAFIFSKLLVPVSIFILILIALSSLLRNKQPVAKKHRNEGENIKEVEIRVIDDEVENSTFNVKKEKS